MSLLKNINSPADLKALSRSELPSLAAEIRNTIVDVVSYLDNMKVTVRFDSGFSKKLLAKFAKLRKE